ncbi:MAG: hypothetical protein QOJ20_4087 [Mycobacterium sp.]|nr:hypothetical protein [Mycobacterium sp.]
MQAARWGSSSVCAASRDPKGYTGFRRPDIPGSAPPRIATLVELGPGSAVVDRDCREDNYR